MGAPWADWIPGVLNKSQTKRLCDEGLIIGEGSLEDAINESSIDLSLSEQAFRMIRGSVKPPGRGGSYGWFIKDAQLAETLKPSTEGTFKLEVRNTYVFKLQERLPKLADGGFYGQATTKSSVGRVDVLVRLIVDGMDSYENFTPEGLVRGGTGDLYLEITPITFNVLVKAGTRLTQLRLFYGDPRDVEIKGSKLFSAVYQNTDKKDGSLTVDLTNEMVGGLEVAAFAATRAQSTYDPIPLWDIGKEKPDPTRHWCFVKANETQRLTIETERFYILRSKERIAVPPGVAIYCRATDETIGEMRIHYAGFVHPAFGLLRKDGQKGTPLIFEVRGHQVDVTLAHGERMANLIFYRMSLDATGKPSGYEKQTLKLSTFFNEWPDKLRLTGGDGSVEADQ